ncbi:unnamed protein product [Mytilus coruscus]|uniref:DZIP3-like HEPN domain-containing protein n=1 Tax=Mytilus coruscus TaxID=42192 RepID=A0A6J8DEW3_MYTCO|nr:unnamed protein product [Mytilus coruscus]
MLQIHNIGMMHSSVLTFIFQLSSWIFGTSNIPPTSEERHGKLGSIVLRVLPRVMQTILQEYISPRGLQMKYRLKDIRTYISEKEQSLMEKLPNMDDFTIELCYKILRFENFMYEPSCKWGNVPEDSAVEIADDIQRIIFAANEIISIKLADVSEIYFEKILKRLQEILHRVDTFLHKDTCLNLYKIICGLNIKYTDILQELVQMQQVNVAEMNDKDIENRDRISRVSFVVIDTFPNILRKIIESVILTSDLYKMYRQHMKNFSTDQQASLEKLKSPNPYDSMDISLMYKLLRQFLLIKTPTKGWGSKPDNVDLKLADDVERIRWYRNQLAHRCSIQIGKDEFDDYFDQFTNIGQRMDVYFHQNTNYKCTITGQKTCRMDIGMQIKYENALKELENIKLRYEKRPIKFFWGESFDRSLTNLRSTLKDEQSAGRRKVRLQIIFQYEDDVEGTVHILNSFKDEINEGLIGVEFIVATKGSIVLDVDILLEMMETDEILQTSLASFLEKILKCIPISCTDSIDIVLFIVEEYTSWKKSKPLGETVFLNFNIEAQLLETDNKMEEQFGQISEAISKHFNRTNYNSTATATFLPISLENIKKKEEAYAQALTPEENIRTTTEDFNKAQKPLKYNLPVSVNLRKQLNIQELRIKNPNIFSCIKIGNALVFADFKNNRLIICNVNSTDMHNIPLSYKPYYITGVNRNTVAVSCYSCTILLIDISRCSVTRTIKTSGNCWGLSYYDNNLYVDIDYNTIHVMDLTGQEIRTTCIPLPSDDILDITVDRNRLVCISVRSIYYCSLDGKLIWKFEDDEYQDLRGVTTDVEGSVYVTNYMTKTVVVISDDGQRYRDLLTESDGLDDPSGIYFDKNDNSLLVCHFGGKVFLFDVKKK